MRRILIIPAFLAALCLTPVLADDPAPENDPAHGVARISLLNGDVSVRRGDSGDVVAAALNAPLVSQDRLLTSSTSRAEVQLDSGNMLRVGSNSEVRLNDVQYGRFQVQVAIGTVTFRVLRNTQTQGEIDTPTVAVRPLRPGVYRITVLEDGSTEITVREGEAEIASQKGNERLQAGNTMLARGSASDPEFQVVAAIGPDDWDRWCEHRDAEIEQAQSRRYVSPDIVGAEDLDHYGRWQTSPEYGNVWVPTVDPGWAPYRAGRWVWEDYYGWTWVSYDPWGWAPYHYGRWFHASFGWGWCPGPIYGRHYWRPALVAFFGFGGGGGFGFGFGNVGWVPLAPFEALHPWWGRGFGGGFGRGFGGGFGRGFNNTTIVNNSNINNMYRNARVMNGVTAVGVNDFGRHTGQFVGMHGSAIRDAGLVRGALPVTPDRASLRMSDRQVRSGAFQERNVNFYSRGGAATGGMRSGVNAGAANGGSGANGAGRGFAGQQVGQQGGAQSGFSQPGAGRQAASGNTATGGHGWSRFGEPIHGSVADTPRQGGGTQQVSPSTNNSGYGRGSSYQQSSPTGSGSSGGGWRRFGEPAAGSSGNGRQAAPSQNYSAPSGGGRYQAAPDRSNPQSYNNGGASGRFGSSGSSQSTPPSNYQPSRQSAPQYSSPNSSPNSSANYGSSSRGGGYSGGGSSQPVRISPPMVHERSAPSSSGYGGGSYRSAPSYSGGGGGGMRSAPAPSYGGGGGRSSGGSSGGGGGHSSSGSSHNSSGNSGGHGGRR
jgi:hypothetical protein